MGSKSSKSSDPSDRYKTDPGTATDNCPAVRPPTKSRRKAIPAQSAFKSIDDHALKAPHSAAQSVKSLVQYLTQPASSDMDRVRAFYRWITHNISYDVAGLSRKHNGDQQAEVVLRRRQGVCEGYANLVLELCREAKIPCQKIHGYSKSLGYVPEVGVTENSPTTHAWNIVYLNGQWGAVEATWGAGRVNDNRRFERHYEELYFLTDPKNFVVKHFPFVDKDIGKSQVYQLLKKPMTLDEFNRSANPDTEGLVWGFRSSQKNHKIEVNEKCLITFRAKNVALQDVSCILKNKNSKTNFKQCVLVRKASKGRITVRVSPLRTGQYDLEIYGRPEGSTQTSLSKMITYAVDCKSVSNNTKLYPQHSGFWGIRANVDVTKLGFSQDLYSKDVLQARNGSFEFRVKVKDKTKSIFRLTDSDEKDMTKYAFGSVAKGFLTIKGNLPKEGFYKIALFGNSSGGTEYDQIGDILVECNSAHPDPTCYPLPGSLWGAKPIAEEYGFTKQIYSKDVFTTGNGELEIRLPTSSDITSSLKLEASQQYAGNLTKSAISFYSERMLVIKIRLPKKGFYKLSVFAGNPTRPNAKNLDLVAEFLIESREDAKEVKPFPKPYSAAEVNRCVLLEPLCGIISANQKVRLRLRSKVLTSLLINNETYKKKSGDMFDVTFSTPASGTLPVCGNTTGDSNFDWLYVYDIK